MLRHEKASARGAASIGLALGIGVGIALAGPAGAQDADASAQATYSEIEAALGKVPEFVKQFPKSAIAGAWAETRDLELSDTTALSRKEKSLISLAVAAQIPCSYCVWLDTKSAREAGATDEEIAEAVAMAGLTRQWSTFFNGMALDFDQFKADLGG
jgi:AhpD family alkylhydroperoxidase